MARYARRNDLGLTLRRAALDEADAIADLINRAYRVEKFFVEGNRTNTDEVRELLENGSFLVLDFVATGVAGPDGIATGADDADGADGGLAAAIYLRIEDSEAYFGMLSVAPSLQGSGLGRRMVAVAEALAEANGCEAMDLQVVNLRSELPPWYRSLGYVECGTAPFPAAEKPKLPCHFIRMRKQLGRAA